jgi:hypothetical protein
MTKDERIQAIEKIILKVSWDAMTNIGRMELATAIEEAIGVDFEKVRRVMSIAREEYGKVGEMWNHDGEEWSEAKAISTNKEVITIK